MQQERDVDFYHGFLDILKVPTHVACWGRWVEEEEPEEVTICIPGNPGLIGFYFPFMKKLHDGINMPTWIIGHAGHEEPGGSQTIGGVGGRENTFNLNGQLLHKIQFIKKYTKPTTKIHLIGHSIGAWMVMQMMKDSEISDRIASINLLFPTMEWMAKTRNGLFFNRVLRRIRLLLLLIVFIFTKFPTIMKTIILRFALFCMNIPYMHKDTILHYIQPSVVNKVIFLATNEMDVVKELDIEILKANKSKIKIMYNKNDGWAPGKYFLQMKHSIPDIYIKEVFYNHSFVLNFSEEVAMLTTNFIVNQS